MLENIIIHMDLLSMLKTGVLKFLLFSHVQLSLEVSVLG